ncbi:MAG: hypothetical protein WBD95_15905 [Xanthobacteraceae bacterium]
MRTANDLIRRFHMAFSKPPISPAVPPPGDRPRSTILGSIGSTEGAEQTKPKIHRLRIKLKPEKSKHEPTRRLPTTRIKFSKQLDVIRAYGIKSLNGTRPASYKDAAEVTDIHLNTVSLMVGFLVENGFLERVGGDTMPTRAVLDFAQAYNWSAETAPRKLAPIVRNSWFGELLLTKLAFRSMSEDEAIAELGGAISAGTEYKSAIGMLIDYAVATGLVRRDGNQLSLGEAAAPEPSSGPSERASSPEQRDDSATSSRSATASVATSFMNTEGAVQFHVSIRVSMQEMSGWTPDRIAAFFAGLAQVLAAKKGTEEIEK